MTMRLLIQVFYFVKHIKDNMFNHLLVFFKENDVIDCVFRKIGGV